MMNKTRSIVRQAGAIVIKPGAPPKVLLIRAKKEPAHWIFPKGNIEPEETAQCAAVRELSEEAGIIGKPVRQAGKSVYCFDGKQYHVIYYLMKYGSTESCGEPGRDPRWYTVDEALALLSFLDSREVLKNMKSSINKMI
jgi:ADP-ribose pyrophosphatase YjhB (NUDIX family)